MMNVNRIAGLFSNPPKWLTSWINGWEWGDERDERTLSSESSLSYAPIWYGVNKISGHVGQLPINVYKRMDRGAERVRDHRIARLMRRPNKYQTSIVFREQMSMNSLLDGNGIAAICREGNVIKELIPLYPSLTATFMFEGEKIHATRPPKYDRLRKYYESSDIAKSEEGVIQLDDIDVIHIPGLSLNGVSGVPLRQIAARNIGASIDAEKRLSSQMKNGFSGNLMLQAPPGVFRNEKDAAEFIQHFEERHNAPEKAGRPGLLREGITANMLAMNNKDAEMIDHRMFQRQDAALWLGLESILGDDKSVSYNSLEQKNLAYMMNCLNRWLRRWEEELEYKLLPDRQYDSESHFVKFNTAALLKSDFEATVAALGSLVTTTIFSRNEAREKLDLNPVPGGDVYENPAITPGEEKTKDEPKNDPPEKKTNDARRAIESHVGHLLGVEANRVKKAAKTVKNFVSWIDWFYDNNFEQNLADNIEAIGIDRNKATEHCTQSKQLLLDVCGRSTAETLYENVCQCVSGWQFRSSEITGGDDV